MNFQLLGTMRVEVDGSPVDLGPPKQRALLALLALNVNQVVATERLIDLMWWLGPTRWPRRQTGVDEGSLTPVLELAGRSSGRRNTIEGILVLDDLREPDQSMRRMIGRLCRRRPTSVKPLRSNTGT
jgi:hypothetical protein